jgi:hypothetical protein
MAIGVPLPGLAQTDNMGEPQTKAKKFPQKSDPFKTFNAWDEETFGQIDIIVEAIAETTNDYTRSKNPTNRYWRAPVKFSYKNYTSDLLKQANVEVPYNRGSNYGEDYMYVCMPKFVGARIAEAAAKQGITVQTDEDRIISTETKWWKTLNNCKERCGVITNDGDFQERRIANAFVNSKKGIRINLDYCVFLRLTKDDKSDRNDKDVFRVVLDCSRVALKEVRVDVEPPPLTSRVPTSNAMKDDIATDDLIAQLESLGV